MAIHVPLNELLKACSGIRTEEKISEDWKQEKYTHYKHFFEGETIGIPDDVYIKINGTATKGTIGHLVDIDFHQMPGHRDRPVGGWDTTFILSVDGRPNVSRIQQTHADILANHDGTTKFVRNVKKHLQVEIPPHVNKYMQQLNKGDWAVGLGTRKTIHFGQITKWSKASVYVNPTAEIKGSTHYLISHPRECFKLPEEVDYTQLITMMILQGWKP